MLLMGLFFSVSSCDYLAVSDQMSGGLQNTDQIFENVAYTKRWYANVFAGIPDYSGINSLNVGAFKNPWAAICDELVVGYGNAAKANNSDKNAATAGFHRYGDCYKYIRQANIFLEKAHVIYMNDGLPIKETDYLPKSTLYKEDGYGTYKDKNDGKYSKNYTNVTVSNRYLNREARFYNTVFFNGRQWPVTCKQVQFYNGGNAGVQEGQATTTGYMLFKRFNRSISKTSPGVASQNRPSIIFRLADFYLIYAEVANEVNPSDSRVLTYLNLVRERAGLPKVEILNPGIVGNKELQRAAIQRERQIELATEGQRYFDVRRWMIADKDGEGRQNGYAHGMNVRGTINDTEEFNRVVETEKIVFNRKMYLQPIPDHEMRKTQNLVQNPGW